MGQGNLKNYGIRFLGKVNEARTEYFDRSVVFADEVDNVFIENRESIVIANKYNNTTKGQDNEGTFIAKEATGAIGGLPFEGVIICKKARNFRRHSNYTNRKKVLICGEAGADIGWCDEVTRDPKISEIFIGRVVNSQTGHEMSKSQLLEAAADNITGELRTKHPLWASNKKQWLRDCVKIVGKPLIKKLDKFFEKIEKIKEQAEKDRSNFEKIKEDIEKKINDIIEFCEQSRTVEGNPLPKKEFEKYREGLRKDTSEYW